MRISSEGVKVRLLGLGSLGLEVGRCARGGEVLGKDRLKEGAEDDLGTVGLWKSHPENKDELEGVIERKPVNGTDCTLKNGQKSIDHPVRQPLGIIGSSRGKQSMKRVVCWDDKADGVDEEFGSDVEKDQKEVQSTKAKHNVDLLDTGLLLEFVEIAILAQLLIELGDMVLSAVLERHCENCGDGCAWKSGLQCLVSSGWVMW